jgi:nitrogen fixation NifU-like protein
MKNLLKKSGYSDKAIEYVIKRVNVGKINHPSACFSYTGHCGDTMMVYLLIEKNHIRNAKFEAIGCAGAFSAGSALMELIRNKSLEEAEKITTGEVIDFLGGIPEQKKDCVDLARTTLMKTIAKMAVNRH